MHINWQTSVFGNFSDILVSSETMIALESTLQKYGLIPSTFLEDSVALQPPDVRPRLDTEDGKWQVMLRRNRIDIVHSGDIEENSDAIAREAFKERTLSIIEQLQEIFALTATGLALDISGATGEFEPEIYKKVALATPYYQENQPQEWALSSVARLNWELSGASVQLDVCSALSQDYDELKVQLQISTVPNISQQFDMSAMDSFLSQALATGERLQNDLCTLGIRF